MIGTIINSAAIALGAGLGLAGRTGPSPTAQTALKTLIGAYTVYAGVSATWRHINGSAWSCFKQLAIVIVAMMLGRLVGRALRLQDRVNRLGAIATRRFENAQRHPPGAPGDGLVTCTLLFCVPPISLLGALEDGLTGSFRTLGAKAVMDGLAAHTFATLFRRGVLLSAVPVLAIQGTITLLGHALQPTLVAHGLLDSVCATSGLLVFSIALLLLEVRRIQVADYLPSLLVAPLLTRLL